MARFRPSISEWRTPYLLSNFDLVTESLTLIAGNSSVPARIISYSRWTPVVVSSVTPLMAFATSIQDRPSASVWRSSSRNTRHSAESSSVGSGTSPAFSASAPLCTSMVASPPSSRIMLASSPSGQLRIWFVHHQYSSSVSPFQAKTGTPFGIVRRAVRPDDHCGGGMILGGEDVAARPPHLGTQGHQGLDQHRRLHRHVQRAGDLGTSQRLGLAVLRAHGHQPGHLVLGEADLLAAKVGEGQIGNAKIHRWKPRGGIPHPRNRRCTERVGSITGSDATASGISERASSSTAVETTGPDPSEGCVVQHSRQNVQRLGAVRTPATNGRAQRDAPVARPARSSGRRCPAPGRAR